MTLPLLPCPSVGQLEVRHHEVLVVLDVLCSDTKHSALQTGPWII